MGGKEEMREENLCPKCNKPIITDGSCHYPTGKEAYHLECWPNEKNDNIKVGVTLNEEETQPEKHRNRED